MIMGKMNNSVCHEAYCDYIKGKYFGILRDCERKKDYEPLIESLLVELLGAVEEYDSINLNKLYSKTASLKYLKYKYLRETILKDCMPLVESVFKEV